MDRHAGSSPFPALELEKGETVDIWAYYNQADEVELFLNGESLGVKSKPDDAFHVCWRVPFTPGTLKAVSRKDGKEVLTREIRTAGEPARIMLIPDRSALHADGTDLSFVTVEIQDKDGNLVPDADNLLRFTVEGTALSPGQITEIRMIPSALRNRNATLSTEKQWRSYKTRARQEPSG